MANALLILKSLHIFGFVAWFAGLFYLVRIFVYHVEAFDKKDPDKSILSAQYQIMEWRVYTIICQGGMILTWICGISMTSIYVYLAGWEWISLNYWLLIKLFLVILLMGYHHSCKTIIKRLEKGQRPMSSDQFRLYNEVPTIFLLAIVLLAVFKNMLNFVFALGAILALAVFLVIATKLYKKHRLKNQ